MLILLVDGVISQGFYIFRGQAISTTPGEGRVGKATGVGEGTQVPTKSQKLKGCYPKNS